MRYWIMLPYNDNIEHYDKISRVFERKHSRKLQNDGIYISWEEKTQ